MTIKQVKDKFNKEKRREAFNRLRSKNKNAGKQKDDKSWQKELQEIYSPNDIEDYYDYDNIE
jgi:hypothetical protein